VLAVKMPAAATAQGQAAAFEFFKCAVVIFAAQRRDNGFNTS